MRRCNLFSLFFFGVVVQKMICVDVSTLFYVISPRRSAECVRGLYHLMEIKCVHCIVRSVYAVRMKSQLPLHPGVKTKLLADRAQHKLAGKAAS